MMPRALGIDYGERRLGLAASDALGLTAQPLCALERHSDEMDAGRIVEMARQRGVDVIVVGLPVHLDGRESPMAVRARAFASVLAQRWHGTVRLVDERLTSGQAERVLLEADVSRRRRRQSRDAMAAAILLQAHLDGVAGIEVCSSGEGHSG